VLELMVSTRTSSSTYKKRNAMDCGAHREIVGDETLALRFGANLVSPPSYSVTAYGRANPTSFFVLGGGDLDLQHRLLIVSVF
jgi:hypothetical protein